MKIRHALIIGAAVFSGALLAGPASLPVAAATAGESYVTTAKVKYVPHYSIAIWQGYGTARHYSGKKLLHGTSWKVFRRVWAKDQYWYNLGGDQWLAGSYLAVARPKAEILAETIASKTKQLKQTTGQQYVGTVSGLGHTTDIIKGSLKNTAAPEQDGVAMTWGGEVNLSVTDGKTTQIAGHDKASTFLWVQSLKLGDKVTVTDRAGATKVYTVFEKDNVNDQAISMLSGKNRWDDLASAAQGEKLVLQTCLSDTVNRLVWLK